MMRHAGGIIAGGEYALCGLAFDAFESGDHDTPVIEAKPEQLVTCIECRKSIDHAKSFINYRTPKASSN